MDEAILSLNGITKTFSGVYALKDMHLNIKPGTVHALLGENGAGKSTLIKILAGALTPDKGEIVFEGEKYSELSPKKAIDLGIGVVYQEFTLVPHLSVAANVFLGSEPMKHGILDMKKAVKDTLAVVEQLGIEINPKAEANSLSVAYQQLVEIAKTISKEVKLLILDEPTAALSANEVEALFKMINRIKARGISVIYISHRLEELFEIADEVTIMRDGEYIDTMAIKDCTKESMIAKMVGRELGKDYPEGCYRQDEVVLRVSDLKNDRLNGVSFDLYKGEVLGFGGLVGAGRTEVARAIFGADYYEGKIVVNGEEKSIKSPADAIKAGIAFITENRQAQGLVLKMNIKENSTLAALDDLVTHRPVIDNKKERKLIESYKDMLSIKAPGIDLNVSHLSGGNQQKVVLTKWLLTKSDIIIFDEPTRGIDVGVKQEIYQIIKNLAKDGKSIIMISSDMPELIGVSDRIIVMNNGEITGELETGSCTQERILTLATAN